jgi:hypothetical protein
MFEFKEAFRVTMKMGIAGSGAALDDICTGRRRKIR